MIAIKNGHELEAMRQACKITAAARALAGEMVRPGMTTKQIDKAVHDFIVSQGAKPSFLGYHGYPGSACISVNSTVIHGIPGGLVLKEGLNVKIVLLPDGMDPDDFARRNTLDQVQDYIRQNEQDFIGFKTDLLLGEAGGDAQA